MSKNLPNKSGQTSIEYTPMQLEEALLETENLMTSIFCDFFLMDDLALFVREHSPDTYIEGIDTITIGVKKSWITPGVVSTLTTVLPSVELVIPNEWQFEMANVPVRVMIVERDYHFLKNLDSIAHMSSWFLMPNPFDKYWQARYLMK